MTRTEKNASFDSWQFLGDEFFMSLAPPSNSRLFIVHNRDLLFSRNKFFQMCAARHIKWTKISVLITSQSAERESENSSITASSWCWIGKKIGNNEEFDIFLKLRLRSHMSTIADHKRKRKNCNLEGKFDAFSMRVNYRFYVVEQICRSIKFQ